MIGLVLVTHGRLAEEFRQAVEHVVGPQEQFATVCIGPEDDMEQRRREIIDAVSKTDSGRGVVIVTDMFGGTPSNLAISVMDEGRIEVIAGMNLPMLIKLSSRPRQRRDEVRAGRCAERRQEIHQRRQPDPRKVNGSTMAAGKTIVSKLTICNKRGLHARASAKFVQTASRFDAEVSVARDGIEVDGTSILDLMMLAAADGATITVSARGRQAREAVAAIEELVADRFGEES